ncbi:LuxR C-terminal-related transcriptional regulator [Streptomyces sp. NPDC002853]
MILRPDIVALLRADFSNSAIARQLHVSRETVAAHRTELQLPRARSGYKAAESPQELFWRHVQPTGDTHLMWTGYTTGRGVPELKHRGRVYTAYRIAFSLAHTRPPVGHVRTGCERDGCVHPRCVEDQQMRDEYRAIFGEAA